MEMIQKPDSQFLEELDNLYRDFDVVLSYVWNSLRHRIFDLEARLDFRMDEYVDGERYQHYYPMPVIWVRDYFEVDIHFDSIWFTSVKDRNESIYDPYTGFKNYPIQSIIIEDKFTEEVLYIGPPDFKKIIEKIEESDARKIIFTFVMPMDMDSNTIYNFGKLLRKYGFHT